MNFFVLIEIEGEGRRIQVGEEYLMFQTLCLVCRCEEWQCL